MPTKDLVRLVKKYRVRDGRGFDLDDYETENPLGDAMDEKAEARSVLDEGIKELSEIQERLFAQDEWSVLLIFQAPDAAGKDSTIKHVMSGINPQGCHVAAFKRPSDEELDHDYLWRCVRQLPERGRIGIFNRSYYEEVLVVRVHPEILAKQHLPQDLKEDPDIYDHRLEDIRQFERYLGRNGTKVIKFFLNVSKDEQKRRLIERIDEPEKNWKFELNDLNERALWDEYRVAYTNAIRQTASKRAPWYVIPADDKWFMRVAVVTAILHELRGLDIKYPEISDKERAELAQAKKRLMREKD
ncbi:MAG TPA: polyphosphate kinase 2 family protein [Beijerinckiaceae bacterium]|nr:polyphosphate kinase 2 family protein [Beijerinckiaceae bacterium]